MTAPDLTHNAGGKLGSDRPPMSPQRYQRFVLAAGFFLALIVVTGGAVRLTQSGLGCEDWPTCSHDRLVPESSVHGWIEFGNRLLSGVVSVGVGAAVLAAYRRRPRRNDLVNWSWGLVAGVIGQILWGGITVLGKLHPGFVAVHFLLSMVLMWNVVVLWVKSGTGYGPPTPISPRLVPHMRMVTALGALVLAVGTLVTGTGPHAGDSRSDRLGFELSSIARIHSLTAWVFLGSLLLLAYRASQSGERSADLIQALRPTIIAAVAQGIVGYAQYFTGVPAILVALHLLGATLMWSSLVWTHLQFWDRPTEE